MNVKPRDPSATIRDPRSGVKLPSEGGRVPDSPYWRRRLKDGDVVEIGGEKPKQKAKPKTTKAPKADKAEKPEREEG